MKILVPVKRVIDYNVKVRVKPDGRRRSRQCQDVDEPVRRNRRRRGLRLKEAGKATEVSPFPSVRSRRRKPPHRARHGRRPRHPGQDRRQLVEPLAVAKILKGVVERGKAGTSSSSASRPSTTMQPDRPDAGRPAWLEPGTFASKVEIGDGSADVTREVDGGLQTIKLKLPAIVTTDLRLNEPRYASLPNIMKAKKKPLDEKTPATTASTLRRA
jgi:electron transfer flavoprotein beta subunit